MTFKDIQIACWKRRPMPRPSVLHKMLNMTKQESEEWMNKNFPPVRQWWNEIICEEIDDLHE